jgi:hypothetical protein
VCGGEGHRRSKIDKWTQQSGGDGIGGLWAADSRPTRANSTGSSIFCGNGGGTIPVHPAQSSPPSILPTFPLLATEVDSFVVDFIIKFAAYYIFLIFMSFYVILGL